MVDVAEGLQVRAEVKAGEVEERDQDGTRKEVNRCGFATKAAALKAMREAQAAGDKLAYIEPSKQKLGDYGAQVIDGMRLKGQTRASYACAARRASST